MPQMPMGMGLPFGPGMGGQDDGEAPDMDQFNNMMKQFMQMTEQVIKDEGGGEEDDEKLKETKKIFNECVDSVTENVKKAGTEEPKDGKSEAKTEDKKPIPNMPTEEEMMQNPFASLLAGM